MDRILRIAKNIVARSQIIKKCMIHENLCTIHIEESIWMQDNAYDIRKLMNDIDGFAYDAGRELTFICGKVCDKNGIVVSVDKENGLFNMSYDCTVQYDDAMLERIKMSEFVVNEF